LTLGFAVFLLLLLHSMLLLLLLLSAGDTEVVNGHVDNMACFIRPGVVAISWTEDKTDPQYECSSRNVEILENSTDAKGRKLEIIKVPCPPPMFRTHREADSVDPEHITKGYVPRLANARLPGSYINHYCANGGAVVPQFGYPTDQQAIDVLQVCARGGGGGGLLGGSAYTLA
jgi:agmatine deiminase